MKGFRYYACLGSLCVVANCAALPVWADEDQTAAPASESGAAITAAHDRGRSVDDVFSKAYGQSDNSQGTVPLDELFKQIKAHTPKPTPTLGAAPPKAHTSSLIAHRHHHPAGKAQSAAVAKAQPAIEAKPGSSGADQLTVYHGTPGGNMVAVSTAGQTGDTTPVVEAKLDRPGRQPTYKAGDHMVINLKANRDCNVIVFDFDSHGNLTKLYPNDYEQDGTLHAGQSIQLGGENSKYTLDIDGSGMERIFVYASPISQGEITIAMNPVPNTPFRAVSMTAEEFDRLVKESKNFDEFDEQKPASRGVHVTPKEGATTQPAAYAAQKPLNKVELWFKIIQ